MAKSPTTSAAMHGHASGLASAKAKLLGAFEKWPLWADAIPPTDLKHPRVSAELAAMDGA